MQHFSFKLLSTNWIKKTHIFCEKKSESRKRCDLGEPVGCAAKQAAHRDSWFATPNPSQSSTPLPQPMTGKVLKLSFVETALEQRENATQQSDLGSLMWT